MPCSQSAKPTQATAPTMTVMAVAATVPAGYTVCAARSRPRAARKSRAALDELERQHHSGPDVIARVAQAMRDCEANASQLASLKQAVDDYADFQWSHMRKEEQEILPAAERALLPADWELIDAAFKSNNDPLVGVERQQEFRELFRRVVNLMPAPMGLGPAQG